jgi:DNA-binding PadR family transcriptional regulator
MTTSSDPLATFQPLSPTELAIMLALANRDEHAYALPNRITADSLGATIVAPSSIKTTLPRLLQHGWIEKTTLWGRQTTRSRQNYMLTESGWMRLEQEQRRLRQSLRLLDGHLAARQRALHLSDAI